MTIDYWNRQIERWTDIFSVGEPDLMGLELIREFDNLANKIYGNFGDDWNWRPDAEIYVGYRSEVLRREVNFILESSYPKVRSTMEKKAETETFGTRTEEAEPVSSEDIVVSDNNIKIILQLPINNKKKNIKVVANDDYSVTISYLNYERRRCSRTLEIPYDINFETAKATYRNGILEVIFDR